MVEDAMIGAIRSLWKRLKDSHNPRFNPHCWITGEPEIGEQVWIGAFTLIDAQGGLKIGKGTDISSGAHIITHSTVWRCVSERRFSENQRAPVEIGDYCFIGENATVLRGAKIGHHSVIAAGAVVPEFMDIPPYSMVKGVPARVVRSIKEEIEKTVQQGRLR
jgi:acetyltransferase-like isoleucine patch superfamily enzyme